MRKLSGADSRHQKALKSHFGYGWHGTIHHCTLPSAAKMVASCSAAEKSRGCGGDDGEWWRSLYYGFDGFRGILYEHIA